MHFLLFYLFFFFNDTATTEIYTLSLHDALPIYDLQRHRRLVELGPVRPRVGEPDHLVRRVAVVVQHPLPRGERLVRVVHVQDRLEVVPPVDQRDVDLPPEDHAGAVRRVLGLAVALAPRRRRPPAIGRQVHVAGAPDVDVGGEAGREDVRADLLPHVLRLLPRSDARG